jgi:hypothetical protein
MKTHFIIKTHLIVSIASAAVVLLAATVAATAVPVPLPCPSSACVHPAPAPLLAAGIPAFVALGGGLTARKLWRKFRRM